MRIEAVERRPTQQYQRRLSKRHFMIGLASVAIPASLALAQTDHLVLYPLMKGELIKESQYILDMSDRSAADNGKARSPLSAAEWLKLSRAAQRVVGAAGEMESVSAVDVIGQGDELIPGTLRAAAATDVQRYIASHRTEFSAYARQLSSVAGEVREAAAERNTRKLASAAEQLDRACGACHLQFWYPQVNER